MALNRSKFAADMMHRLWDDHHGRWVVGSHGRSIWVMERTCENLRQKMIDEGRSPDTLSVEAVWIQCK